MLQKIEKSAMITHNLEKKIAKKQGQCNGDLFLQNFRAQKVHFFADLYALIFS